MYSRISSEPCARARQWVSKYYNISPEILNQIKLELVDWLKSDAAILDIKKISDERKEVTDARALDTQCLFLSRYNLFDAFLSQIKHLIHLVAGKGLLFGCSLHFHEFAAFSHNYIHIHINC